MPTPRRLLAATLLALLAAAPTRAEEPGVVQRTGRAIDRGARRTAGAVGRGAQRTGAALNRAGNWTAERARRVRRRVAGGS